MSEPTDKRPRAFLKLALIAAAVVGLTVAARLLPVAEWIELLRARVTELGAAGVVVFALAYVLAALLFVPGSALTLAAGAVFGLATGTAIVSVAATTAAALAFLIARHLARARVAALIRRYPRFRAVDDAIGQGGWRVVALLRLSPAIPFSAGNYLYGLTQVRFWPYLAASWGAMLPGTFLYVYLGYAGSAGLRAVGGEEPPAGDAGRTALLAVGLLATVAVTIYVTRLARRALRERSGELAATGGGRSDDARRPGGAATR